MPTIHEFRLEIRHWMQIASAQGSQFLEINSGELHRSMGGYPGVSHQMPSCCEAMYAEQRNGDEIINAPPKGKGASLTIRYELPR